jgi:hypothetical protein
VEVALGDALLLCLFALLAGALDAVVGGGGLVQLPALLVVLPQVPVVALLGTNKLASVVGTASAAITYNRRFAVDRRTAGAMAVAAFAGSGAGALLATSVDGDVLEPVVLVALVAVLAHTVRTPSLGEVERLRLSAGSQRAVALAGGAGIGFYDGLVGPGTGSFLVFLLVGAVGPVVPARQRDRKVGQHHDQPVGAACCSPPAGTCSGRSAPHWPVANLLGSQLGTRLALRPRAAPGCGRVFRRRRQRTGPAPGVGRPALTDAGVL